MTRSSSCSSANVNETKFMAGAWRINLTTSPVTSLRASGYVICSLKSLSYLANKLSFFMIFTFHTYPSCLPQIRLKFVVFGGTLRVCFAKVPVRAVGVGLLIFCPCDHRAYFFGDPVGYIFEAKARPESGSQKIGADPIGITNLEAISAC